MTQSDQKTDLTAAEWAVRLNERALTAQEQAELDQWLASNNLDIAVHFCAPVRSGRTWIACQR